MAENTGKRVFRVGETIKFIDRGGWNLCEGEIIGFLVSAGPRAPWQVAVSASDVLEEEPKVIARNTALWGCDRCCEETQHSRNVTQGRVFFRCVRCGKRTGTSPIGGI